MVHSGLEGVHCSLSLIPSNIPLLSLSVPLLGMTYFLRRIFRIVFDIPKQCGVKSISYVSFENCILMRL